jgi:hypothetical protein
VEGRPKKSIFNHNNIKVGGASSNRRLVNKSINSNVQALANQSSYSNQFLIKKLSNMPNGEDGPGSRNVAPIG